MARAEIYIEDADDGAVAARFRFVGGAFDKTSGAHVLALAFKKWGDENMTTFPQEEQDAEPAAEPNLGPIAS